MRDLDLKMEPEGDPPRPEASTPAPAVVVKAGELSTAHEMLLKDIEDVRHATKVMTDCVETLTILLAPTQEELARQSAMQAAMQERVLREALATIEREWAQTAANYRALADELAMSAARLEARAAKPSPGWTVWIAASVGGLLGAILTVWLMRPAIEPARTTGGAAPPAATSVVSDPGVKPKPPAKGQTR